MDSERGHIEKIECFSECRKIYRNEKSISVDFGEHMENALEITMTELFEKPEEYNNKLIDLAKKTGGIDGETIQVMIRLIAPFAPHMAEELWEKAGNTNSVFDKENGWPEYDEALMADDEVEVAVQINGRTKAVIIVAKDIAKEEAIAKGKEALGDKLTGNVIKEIYVPGRIINIVAK